MENRDVDLDSVQDQRWEGEYDSKSPICSPNSGTE